jgi:hypothetical protein
MKRYFTSALIVVQFLSAALSLLHAKNLDTEQNLTTIPRITLPPGMNSDEILVEIFEKVGSSTEWPEELGPADQSFTIPCFALFGFPQKYGALAERLSYQGPLIVRLTGQVDFPEGSANILSRTNGMSRIWIDGEIIKEIDAVPQNRDAHGHMRPAGDPTLPYPRARLGTMDTKTKIQTKAGAQVLILESVIGLSKGSTPLYEMLVAMEEPEKDKWHLLDSNVTRTVPFSLAHLTELRKSQSKDFEALNRETRTVAQANLESYWKSRHSKAKRYVQSLPRIKPKSAKINFKATNVIDQFIEAKISKNNAEANTESRDETFHQEVWPILEENCIRCHGKKSKGGLKLDRLEAALAGGNSEFQTIVPGNAEKSELIFRITTEEEDDRMPNKGDPLTKEQVLSLSQWIDKGAKWASTSGFVAIPDQLDELAFLRRVYLDTVGVVPTSDEIRTYQADSRADKKSRLIDRLLNDPRQADHWVPYWQDVLAENPSLMKPTLNNTGPFRYWIHESLLDNKPFDQFVTELVTFQGDAFAGGAGGFRLATENDSPQAAKAHILGTAFLGMEMKCARCHDSPYHSTTQKDLFSMAAMLNGNPLKLPATSTVPTAFFKKLEGRKPLITISLEPGTPINPEWPFDDLIDERSRKKQEFNSPAVELAWQLTRPENTRFAQVIVNRIWKRYFGQGFVEPAHDWEDSDSSHPELLEYLARDFVSNGYDLKRLSRLILRSEAYGRESIIEPAHTPADRFFVAPLRKRMSAEQLVDSLFHSAGVPMFSEELTLDVEGFWDEATFENYGFPRRAWEFVSTSTERERASLTLPLVNEIVSLMSAYGWRPNRAEPITDRQMDPNVLQSGVLANGSLGLWLTILSDYSTLTTLAHESSSVEELVDELYLRFLTRLPNGQEKEEFVELLTPGFESRKIHSDQPFVTANWIPEIREVSWSNHLSVEANYHVAEKVDRLLAGPKPTDSIATDWRERMEDAVWVLVNTPEFQYIQ